METTTMNDLDPTARWSWMRRHGLSLALFALFISSWTGQFVAQGIQAEREGEDFWPAFWASTFENWQSEFLQLLTFVLLTAILIHRGSHESKESSDRMEAKIDVLLERTGGAADA